MSTRTGRATDLGIERIQVLDPKLQRPRVRPGAVVRTALIDRMRRARGASVVAVSAPVGYGKTTLLAQWAARDRRRFAWLSMDKSDNNPSTLLAHLALALEPVHPTPADVLESVAGDPPVVDAATRLLVSFVAAVRAPFVLVVDDVHELTDRSCVGVLESLAAAIPEGSALVLSGRHEGVSLSRMRASGRVVDVTPEDLAMDEPDARRLLEGTGVRPPAAQIADITWRTEGWPAGLYLTALAQQDRRSASRPLADVGGAHPLVADYLASEFLSGVSRRKAVFMTRTSVLERMSAPLCDAVLGSAGSASMLRSLELSNSFLIRLDQRREWYRYHHLVREFLRAELQRREPGFDAELAARAAAWCEDNGLLESAVDYAHAAGDPQRTARLVARVAKRTYASGDGPTLARWFTWVEEDGSLERYPPVAVQGAAVHALLGEPAEADRWADAAERRRFHGEAPDGSPYEAWLSVLRALMCRGGVDQMKQDAERAVELLAADSSWRSSAVLLSGVASLLKGDAEEADARLSDAAELAVHARSRAPAMAAFAERAFIAMSSSRWRAAGDFVERAREIGEDARIETYATSALFFAASARVALHEGAVASARRDFGRGIRQQPRLTYALPHFAVQALLELAGVGIALGDAGAAGTLLREARQVIRRRPGLGILSGMADEIGGRLQFVRNETPGASALTAAELRLLPLLSTHLSFREIAGELHVSPHTVKSQAISLYRKLGVSSRSEAIGRAREQSLLPA